MRLTGLKFTQLRFSALTLLLLGGCAIIRPGEVGVKQILGRLDTKIHEPGGVLINPIVTTMVKMPTRTMNLEVELNLPSKEGLNINAIISILYNIKNNGKRKNRNLERN